MTLLAFIFRTLRTPKTRLDKCLKSPVSEDPSRSNMADMGKHCWNMHHTIFIFFIDHCQENWVRILVLLVNILAADEKSPVLNRDNITITIQMQLSQKQKTFSRFFSAFLKSTLNFKHFEKKMTRIAFVFRKLRTPKTKLDKCLKSKVSEDPSTSNMADVPKHCWNLHHSIFLWFIDPCQVNWVRKSPSYWHAKSWDSLLTHWLPMKSILFFIETI